MFRNWYANIPQTRGIYTDNTVFVPLTTQPVVFTSYKFNYRRRNERGIFKKSQSTITKVFRILNIWVIILWLSCPYKPLSNNTIHREREHKILKTWQFYNFKS